MSEKLYKFGVYLTIEALDFDDALYNFDRLLESHGVIDSYNFDIKEIEA